MTCRGRVASRGVSMWFYLGLVFLAPTRMAAADAPVETYVTIPSTLGKDPTAATFLLGPTDPKTLVAAYLFTNTNGKPACGGLRISDTSNLASPRVFLDHTPPGANALAPPTLTFDKQ